MLRRIVLAQNGSLSRAVSQRGRMAFSHSALVNQISPFGMPAMSPTMEQGGIVSWKVKEGDSFSAGDVILEVETDKSQIDVEAADDGVMAKIISPEGSKDIPVNTPIAYVAEPGDDISNFEIPVEEPKQSKKSTESEASKPESRQKSPQNESPLKGGKANPSQTLFPSVETLLHRHGISSEEAFKSISASGPKGRILKGDVLAYLGEISSEANAKISSFIDSKSHLDLSNIVLKEPSTEALKAPEASPKKEPLKVTKSLVFTKDVPVETVQSLVDIAEKTAIQFAYSSPLGQTSALSDPLFDDIVAPVRDTARFSVKVRVNGPKSLTSSASLFDEILGAGQSVTFADSPPFVDLELVINEKVPDAKERADLFVSMFTTCLKDSVA